jgi:hypothetical protein
MNDNGNKYALAALKDRRARLAGEIFALKKQIQAKLGEMAHLDATMVLFDPEAHPSSIQPKRVVAYQRVPLFSHGELGRVILDVLREAKGEPLAAHDISVRTMVKLSQPASAKMAITSRVRSNLTYLKKQLKVAKVGDKQSARWQLKFDGTPVLF